VLVCSVSAGVSTTQTLSCSMVLVARLYTEKVVWLLRVRVHENQNSAALRCVSCRVV
jgi:hypothetical protein